MFTFVHSKMRNKNSSYKALISSLIFIIFFGVIVNDLIEMHIKLICHIELSDQNNQFLKPAKDKSKELSKTNCCIPVYKDLFSFLIANTETKSYFIQSYFYTEKICLTEIRFSSESFQLRAPPIS